MIVPSRPRRRAAFLLLLAGGAGCAPLPRLAVTPEVLSGEWRAGPAAPSLVAAPPESLAAALGAPELAALTRRAMANNADLGAALARIDQARAQARIARAAMLPEVTATAGASATRAGGDSGVRFQSNGGFGGIDVAYEVDLFGGQSAGRRAARARAAAAAFDRDALALVVEAELARQLVRHAALTGRIALLDRNLGEARELARIVGIRQRLGEATRIESGVQAIAVQQLEAERSRLEEARTLTGNAVALLVGEEAPRFDVPVISLADLRVPDLSVPPPAELVVRRPDVRAAEARIAAAAGDVAQARAAFLPRLRLSASAIGEAVSLGGPIAAVLSVGAGLLAPIFDGGRLRGELDVSAATQRESVELYRGALLTALRETEDALTAAAASRRRTSLLAQTAETARETARLSVLRYVGGEAELQFAADARADLVRAEDAQLIGVQERLEAAIDLYRAMGGAVTPAVRAASR